MFYNESSDFILELYITSIYIYIFLLDFVKPVFPKGKFRNIMQYCRRTAFYLGHAAERFRLASSRRAPAPCASALPPSFLGVRSHYVDGTWNVIISRSLDGCARAAVRCPRPRPRPPPLRRHYWSRTWRRKWRSGWRVASTPVSVTPHPHPIVAPPHP